VVAPASTVRARSADARSGNPTTRRYTPMKRLVLAVALAAAVPFAASAADGVNYNYVQGGYVATNTSGPDADGWGLGGSVAVHPNVHLFADYARQDIKNTAYNYDQWRVGGGYNTAINSQTDFVANVAYERL